MVEAQEQMSDLRWAMSVIKGEKKMEQDCEFGTDCAERERETILINLSPEEVLDDDSAEHAEWLIRQIERNGVTFSIRKIASEFLESMKPMYANCWH